MTEGAALAAVSKPSRLSSLWVCRLMKIRHRHLETHGAAGDACLVAFDDAGFLQGADAARNGGGREGNALGELDLAQASIFEKGVMNGVIERV